MQASLDRDRRRDLRQKIITNITAIALKSDELERLVSETKDHLHQNDRFFFKQQANIAEDEGYGSNDELEELYVDTIRLLNRLESAQMRLSSACRLAHFYDYSSNQCFEEYSSEQAGYL